MADTAQFFEQLTSLFRNLSAGKRLTLVVLIAGTVAGFALLTNWSGAVDLRPIYSNLDPEDAGAIVAKLKEQKVPFRVGPDGRSILVPAETLHEIRMQLAS